jgi:hypothetical protein
MGSVATLDFTFEFHTEIPDLRDAYLYELRTKAERQLLALSEGHTDLTGASIALEKPAEAESAYLYQARVVVYARPEHVAAVEKDETIEGALSGALDAVERQVRERRAKLAERWKQP